MIPTIKLVVSSQPGEEIGLEFNATFNILGHIMAVSFIAQSQPPTLASNWHTSQHAYMYLVVGGM